MRAALAALVRVPDDALERHWSWSGGEMELRYGFYRQYEALELARAQVGRLLADAKLSDTVGRPIAAAATAARWDLHGLITPLTNEELDRDPNNGEWTVRQTLAHIVSGQRGYGLFTAWWLSNHFATAEDLVPSAPEELESEIPAEEDEAPGSVDEIDLRLGETVDSSVAAFAPLGVDDLAWRARWSGRAVTVGFRVNRWSSHIREHVIQVEKTLGFIDRQPTEVERLMRLIAGSYGRLEQEVFFVPASSAAVSEALALVESTASGVLADAKLVVDAAS